MAKKKPTTVVVTADDQNANQGTARGAAMLRDSLETCGAGRSIVTDKHGTIIGGNKSFAAATALGLPTTLVETTGEELVVVQRTDLDLATDAKARQLAYYDNRTQEVDLAWSLPQVQADVLAGIEVGHVFFPHELPALTLPPLPSVDLATEGPAPPTVPKPRFVLTFRTLEERTRWQRFLQRVHEAHPEVPAGPARLSAHLTSIGIPLLP